MQTSQLTARSGPVTARSRRWSPCGAGSARLRENPAGPNRAASTAYIFSTHSFHGCGAGRPNRETVWSRIAHGSAHQDCHAPGGPTAADPPAPGEPRGHYACLTSDRLAGRGPLVGTRAQERARSVRGHLPGRPTGQTHLVVARTRRAAGESRPPIRAPTAAAGARTGDSARAPPSSLPLVFPWPAPKQAPTPRCAGAAEGAAEAATGARCVPAQFYTPTSARGWPGHQTRLRAPPPPRPQVCAPDLSRRRPPHRLTRARRRAPVPLHLWALRPACARALCVA